MSDSFVKVGKMKDAHGIRGELFIILFAKEASWLPNLKELRLVKEAGPGAVAAEPIKYSVKSARPHKNGLIVKTNEIKDRNEAESLRGLLLEVPESFVVSKPGEAMFLREISDFKVFVEGRGEIGRITSFSSNVAQDLLVVTTSWGVFEIPFVDAFVRKINHKTQEIHLDLPPGLLGDLDGGKQDDGLADSNHPDTDEVE